MSNYTPFEGLAFHEKAFLDIRSQAKHLSGLDAARMLISQCSIVRRQRHLALQDQQVVNLQVAKKREEDLPGFLTQCAGTKEPELFTQAEGLIVGRECLPLPWPVGPEPLAA